MFRPRPHNVSFRLFLSVREMSGSCEVKRIPVSLLREAMEPEPWGVMNVKAAVMRWWAEFMVHEWILMKFAMKRVNYDEAGMNLKIHVQTHHWRIRQLHKTNCRGLNNYFAVSETFPHSIRLWGFNYPFEDVVLDCRLHSASSFRRQWANRTLSRGEAETKEINFIRFISR